MKNRVYFFTGTGNSLKIAKDIASALPQCEIIPICKGTDTKVPTGYDRIGFVFPVYFFGLPKMVADFVKSLEVSVDNASYWFAIATPGGFSGKPLAQFNSLLAEKNMSLSYGQKIRMNANYIARYGSMNFLLKTAMRAYDRKIKKIVMSINNTEKSIIEKSSKRVHKIYQDSIENIHSIDEDYTVTDDCNGCGICEGICPANNIVVDADYPVFQHKCESCMACIQSCPNRVINFKDKTQSRKRYMHPDVTPMEIIEYYEAFR